MSLKIYPMAEKSVNKYVKNNGFTLVETIIAMGLFAVISLAVYQAYGNILELIIRNQWRSDAVSVLQNEIEIIRGMPFEDVGILNGYPSGKILSEKLVTMDMNTFTVKATVRSIDDAFDGTQGGSPNDTAPADYKLVELEATCNSCSGFGRVSLTTTVAPKGLETTTNNGSLFINVFDANGEPVSDANIIVTNNILNPHLNIIDRSDNNGILQLVDIPTSTMAYHIVVSKAGYSSDQTYSLGDIQNPNPVKPDVTVASQQITSASFAIDRVSSINFNAIDQMCSSVPNIDIGLDGAKFIGTVPDVLKFSQIFTTDIAGHQAINSLEWDTYNLINSDGQYDLAGTIPLMPIDINSNSDLNLKALMVLKNLSALLVTAQDEDGQPINDVNIQLTKSGYDQTILTGRKTFSETDWSSGKYSFKSDNINESVVGELKLALVEGGYATTTEWLVSNTIDFGNSNTIFYKLNWNPLSQPSQSGLDSLKLQLASNNDNTTWDFLGPDGTSNTFYTASGANINAVHNNKRYLQYKVFLKTENSNYTPEFNLINVDFSSGCVPSGQAYFNGLSTGIYSINISKVGYQTITNSNLAISSDWQEYKAELLEE